MRVTRTSKTTIRNLDGHFNQQKQSYVKSLFHNPLNQGGVKSYSQRANVLQSLSSVPGHLCLKWRKENNIYIYTVSYHSFQQKLLTEVAFLSVCERNSEQAKFTK